MIVGIGSDIARVARFEAAMARHGARFAARILGPEEQRRLAGHSQPAAFLAKRFAAKEAFVKALGLGLTQGMQWREIEILNDTRGKPYLQLHGAAAACATAAGVGSSHVSLSDEAEYAVAFVVLERL
ncbi:holo-ACP synthase [Vreelandella massiliensis]|uniref:holo-ACP synthase n=1 Tax=Vreelandella massiliensis TaxID=1816686 RepID=UPI00096A60EB|nr:holo-ACP synthase [Halomonas massiliensis]MYL24510.1 holo-ACP synthase [Halomonas alkaliantarctica]